MNYTNANSRMNKGGEGHATLGSLTSEMFQESRVGTISTKRLSAGEIVNAVSSMAKLIAFAKCYEPRTSRFCALVLASRKSSPISLISSTSIVDRPAIPASIDAGVKSCKAYLESKVTVLVKSRWKGNKPK